METNSTVDLTEFNRLIDEFKTQHERKLKLKSNILKAAQILESENHPTNQICTKICNDLIDKGVDASKVKRLVRRVLPAKYKDASKITRSNV